ncbi:hypothetical protein DVH05_016855 [Phytophthora capsici]|nr:hypothetical protein DVH05_016855 [Phytophthora capsici]
MSSTETASNVLCVAYSPPLSTVHKEAAATKPHKSYVHVDVTTSTVAFPLKQRHEAETEQELSTRTSLLTDFNSAAIYTWCKSLGASRIKILDTPPLHQRQHSDYCTAYNSMSQSSAQRPVPCARCITARERAI